MADFAGVLKELKAKLSGLDKARAELVTAINAIERIQHGEGIPMPTPHPTFNVVTSDNKESMPAAIERTMMAVGRMMETPEVVSALWRLQGQSQELSGAGLQHFVAHGRQG